jgi:hypothetical protein
MRFILQVILTALLAYLIELWLPSWAIVVCAAMVAILIRNPAATSFFSGFVAISLLWMTKATLIDVYTDSIISTKIAPLLGFQRPIILILITGLVGGILGGLSSLIGHQLYRALQKKSGDFYRE